MDPDNVPADFKDVVGKLDPGIKAKWRELFALHAQVEAAGREANKAVLEAHAEISQMTLALSAAKSRFVNSEGVREAVYAMEDALKDLSTDTVNYKAWTAEYRQDLTNLLALESARAEAAVRERNRTKGELDQLNQ
jgi:hypothetical protein